MSPSVLIERKGMPLNVVAAIGARQFLAAEHTQGLKPKVLLVHPQELPQESLAGDLRVYASREVPRRHARIAAWFDPEKEGQRQPEKAEKYV